MKHTFKQWIPMVSYPEAESVAAISSMEKNGSASLNSFLDFISGTELPDLQEKFTQTFDMSPNTCLDLGWHLYGEAYERGAFMLKIRELLREQGIAETSELPDHLSHILAALDGLNPDDQKPMVHQFIQPALTKILAGFKDSDNPFQFAIQYMDEQLKRQFGTEGGDA